MNATSKMNQNRRKQVKQQSKDMGSLVNALKSIAIKPKSKRPQRKTAMKTAMTRRSGASGIMVTNTEVLSEISILKTQTSVAGSATLSPGSGPVIMKKFGEMYDQYRIHKVSYRFVPTVSALTSGSIAFGVDYNTSASPTTRASVLTLSPHTAGPLRKSGLTVSVPKSECNPDLIRYTSSDSALMSKPFALAWFADTSPASTTSDTPVGYFEITYTLEFMGIRP